MSVQPLSLSWVEGMVKLLTAFLAAAGLGRQSQESGGLLQSPSIVSSTLDQLAEVTTVVIHCVPYALSTPLLRMAQVQRFVRPEFSLRALVSQSSVAPVLFDAHWLLWCESSHSRNVTYAWFECESHLHETLGAEVPTWQGAV